jgi:hypothetical protein
MVEGLAVAATVAAVLTAAVMVVDTTGRTETPAVEVPQAQPSPKFSLVLEQAKLSFLDPNFGRNLEI